jgi:uncharacterized delta-60 repeat protein
MFKAFCKYLDCRRRHILMAVLGTIVSQINRYVPTYTIASNSHTFTTCGLTGRVGPTQAEMRAAYNTSANGNWDETYITQGQYQGYQDWKVPVSGTYEFSVMGASGYNGSGAGSAGRGARIIGRLRLVKGEIITIAVGQSGGAPNSGTIWGGSGGGTFVVRKLDTTPLFIAGGGSGEPNTGIGRDGVLTNNGGTSTNGTLGGSSGFGGQATGGRSGGGGGMFGRGGNSFDNPPHLGGGSFLDGLTMETNTRIGGYGGFGGGGQSDGNFVGQSGGGGGFSGGAGARATTAMHAGGGGGSYISPLATNVATSTGLFNGGSMLNGQQSNRVIRLNSNGTKDTTFITNVSGGANNTVTAVGLQSDGKVIFGGNFTTFNGNSINRIIRLNSDGTTDTVFSTNIGVGAPTQINSIVVQPDQKILVGGIFSGFNVSTVGRIIRLNSDGTTDTSFVTNTGTGAGNTVNTIAVQSDGKILLGGTFTTFNGTTGIGRIIRLNSDGTRDTSFVGTGAANTVNAIAVQSDGKIIVGGDFTTFNGTAGINRIVRLNSDGTRDTSFSTNVGTGANVAINSIAIQSDGKIVIAGNFAVFNGVQGAGIVRLNSDGTRDTAFTTNGGTGLNGGANAVGVQSDGKIIVGGGFTAFDNLLVYRLVRLNSDGTLDTVFKENIGTGLSNFVFSIIFQPDGKPIIAGGFDMFNGTPIVNISAFNTGQGSVTVTLL